MVCLGNSHQSFVAWGLGGMRTRAEAKKEGRWGPESRVLDSVCGHRGAIRGFEQGGCINEYSLGCK